MKSGTRILLLIFVIGPCCCGGFQVGPECSEGYFSCSRRSERECVPETRTAAKSARTELEDNKYGYNYLKLNSRVNYFVKFSDI